MSMTISLDFHAVGNPLGVPFHFGLAGTLTSTGNDLVVRSASIGSSTAEALDFGDITGAPALCVVRCASASANSVELYTSSPYQFSLLEPGQFAVLQVGDGSVEAKGVSGAAQVEYIAIEGVLSGSLIRYVPGISLADELTAGISLSVVLNGITTSFTASFTASVTNNRRYANTRVVAAATDDTGLPSILAGFLLAYRTDSATATPGLYGQGESSKFASLATLPLFFAPWPGTANIVIDADASTQTVVDVVNLH